MGMYERLMKGEYRRDDYTISSVRDLVKDFKFIKTFERSIRYNKLTIALDRSHIKCNDMGLSIDGIIRIILHRLIDSVPQFKEYTDVLKLDTDVSDDIITISILYPKEWIVTITYIDEDIRPDNSFVAMIGLFIAISLYNMGEKRENLQDRVSLVKKTHPKHKHLIDYLIIYSDMTPDEICDEVLENKEYRVIFLDKVEDTIFHQYKDEVCREIMEYEFEDNENIHECNFKYFDFGKFLADLGYTFFGRIAIRKI